MEKQHKGKQGNQLLASLADAMSTHPPSEERVKQMAELAGQTQLASGMIVSTKEFDRFKLVAQRYGKKA
jgi:hypothetical protein